MLGIYFRGGYGSGSLDYPLFHDRDRSKFDNFVLRASGSDEVAAEREVFEQPDELESNDWDDEMEEVELVHEPSLKDMIRELEAQEAA